jgi:hypothetical protein
MEQLGVDMSETSDVSVDLVCFTSICVRWYNIKQLHLG